MINKLIRTIDRIVRVIKEELGLIKYSYSKDILHLDKTKYPFRYIVSSTILIDGDKIGEYINHEHITSEIELYGNNAEEILNLVKNGLTLEIQEFFEEDPTGGKIIRETIPVKIITC